MKFILQIQNSPKYVCIDKRCRRALFGTIRINLKADAETNDCEDKVLSFHGKKKKQHGMKNDEKN